MTVRQFGVGRLDRARAGFVLLDLVVTAAIVCLLLGLILPSLTSGTTPARMHLLLANVASMLRNARTSAIAENRDVAFSFDSTHRLFSCGRAFVVLPADVGASVLSGGGCDSGGDVAQVIFHPDGTGCGGVLRFAGEAGTYRIRVNWATGYVEIIRG